MSKPENKSPVKPWELLESNKALDEKWFMVRKDKIRLPSGRIMDDYFVWESPDIAVVAPVTKDGKFVLCRQYRHAIDKIVYQFPAGGVGKNEDAQIGALREMEEETGYVSEKVTKLATLSVYPTKLTGLNHIFIAEDARPEGKKVEDDSELTEVVLLSPQELKDLIASDGVHIADSLVAGLLAMQKLGL